MKKMKNFIITMIISFIFAIIGFATGYANDIAAVLLLVFGFIITILSSVISLSED